ncbi:MAG: hypothetical protein ACREA4_00395, partial [Nitrososphaera sp.]
MQQEPEVNASTESSSPVPPSREEAAPFDPVAFSKGISDAVSRELKGFREELQRSLQAQQEPARQEPAEDKELDWENDFYADPKGTMERFRKELREEIAMEMDTRDAKDNFWGGFYSINQHLKEHDSIMRAILGSRESEWAKEGITVEQAYQRLRDAASVIGGKLAPADKVSEPSVM